MRREPGTPETKGVEDRDLYGYRAIRGEGSF